MQGYFYTMKNEVPFTLKGKVWGLWPSEASLGEKVYFVVQFYGVAWRAINTWSYEKVLPCSPRWWYFYKFLVPYNCWYLKLNKDFFLLNKSNVVRGKWKSNMHVTFLKFLTQRSNYCTTKEKSHSTSCLNFSSSQCLSANDSDGARWGNVKVKLYLSPGKRQYWID